MKEATKIAGPKIHDALFWLLSEFDEMTSLSLLRSQNRTSPSFPPFWGKWKHDLLTGKVFSEIESCFSGTKTDFSRPLICGWLQEPATACCFWCLPLNFGTPCIYWKDLSDHHKQKSVNSGHLQKSEETKLLYLRNPIGTNHIKITISLNNEELIIGC